MPPKKTQAPQQLKAEKGSTKANGTGLDAADAESVTASKKRKMSPTKSSSTAPKKTPRQGNRTSSRSRKGDQSSASSKQTLNFLLSKASLPYCFPSDELSAAHSNPKHFSYALTSPAAFTPFQHLLTAAIFSKPLSHTLGMRSVRTLLNLPFSLTTPEMIVEQGEKRVWEALEEARTQHRQKTAGYIHAMAQTYAESGKGNAMQDLAVDANENGAEGVVDHIKKTVKGMGVTGAEIFCRRVQCVENWGEALWPYADKKSIEALRDCGVHVSDAEELQSLVESEIDQNEIGDTGLREMTGGKSTNKEMQRQVMFVVLLERAIGCVLEGKVEELKKAALNQ